MGENRNINRGYKKLRVWNDAVDLFVLSTQLFSNFPFELKKTAGNAIDAAHSISRNIAEGYCRKSLREYLNFLNIALGACGEFHSCYESFRKANLLDEQSWQKLESLHFKIENELIRLIRALQVKQKSGDWQNNFFDLNSE